MRQEGKEKVDEMHFQIKPRQTILEKLIQNAFGRNVSKLYAQYPNLKQLTQPNLPIIDPRGLEIIKRSQFKESLRLLSNVHTTTKEQPNSQNLQQSFNLAQSQPALKRDQKPQTEAATGHKETNIRNDVSSSSSSSLSRDEIASPINLHPAKKSLVS